jgi:hypothetical protein
VTSILLNDINGNTWEVTVDDSGILGTTMTTPQTPAAVYLNDTTDSQTFLMGIETTGQITLTQETFSASEPTYLPLYSDPSGLPFSLQAVLVPGGVQLQTSAGLPISGPVFAKSSTSAYGGVSMVNAYGGVSMVNAYGASSASMSSIG